MLVHRNISAKELLDLVRQKEITGTKDKDVNIERIYDDTTKLKEDEQLISFFASDYWWIDDEHPYEVWVDIPDYKLITGKGIYYSDENFEKTHVWNGKIGDIKYEIPEVYTKGYTILDVRLIKTVKKPLRNVINDMLKEIGL